MSGPVYDLSKFRLRDMILAGRELRTMRGGATSMEAAAREVVDFLYEKFRLTAGEEHGAALVRCFKTHAMGDLPAELVRVAGASSGIPSTASTLCLTLLASRGELPEWNGREHSKGHRAIPLPTTEMVEQAPMIARLIRQMGLEIGQVIAPGGDFLLDGPQQAFNVFHVEKARSSEFVPAQSTFVIPHGIESVLGFGGLLPSGELFAVVMFAKVRIPRETAELFRTLSLSVKLALLPFVGGRVFDDGPLESRDGGEAGVGVL